MELKRIVAASSEFRLFGKTACDFLSCDKHLISGVTIRLSLKRSPNDFVIMPEHRAKRYRVEITDANLYMRKMAATDFVQPSIEKTLLKTPAIYICIEILPRTFCYNWCARLATRRHIGQRASPSNDFSNELEYSIHWYQPNKPVS